MSTNPTPPAAHGSNFIRNIIEADLAQGTYAQRRWAGQPGPASVQQVAPPDGAKIRTRFPPEPNGYLHFGHAKSICLNFGMAQQFGGVCHMRFDDTNPVKEDQEYVDAILDTVRWLGFGWEQPQSDGSSRSHLFYASDYFNWLYQFAETLIEAGHAYVDSQTPEQMRANRGTLTEPGKPSPFRDRSIEENLALFRQMRSGAFADGAHILRAKIDMASPNMNLRDPALYRIRHAHHHRTGDAWCIYPMYDYAHCVSDALENITHSICTLEFEDHRPLYDWLLERLVDAGVLLTPLPHQYEFARLNLTYVVLSKRKLIQLVDEGYVSGWDDPRMPTLVGARRRGYTAEGFHRFTDRIGVSKSDSWIDYSVLEDCMREHLNETAERRVAVLDPLKLVLDNLDPTFEEVCTTPNHPQKPELGLRSMPLTRELWIEREDFMETPVKGYFRLFPGNRVRLRYGFVIECTGCDKDADGNITAVHAQVLPDSKSGTPGADQYKVKGNIHWVSATHGLPVSVRMYDRLFAVANPGARREGDAPDAERDYLDDLNPDSIKTLQAFVEPALRDAQAEQRFQFERHGYFVADRFDSKPGAPVFNRTVTLRDGWASKK